MKHSIVFDFLLAYSVLFCHPLFLAVPLQKVYCQVHAICALSCQTGVVPYPDVWCLQTICSISPRRRSPHAPDETWSRAACRNVAQPYFTQSSSVSIGLSLCPTFWFVCSWSHLFLSISWTVTNSDLDMSSVNTVKGAVHMHSFTKVVGFFALSPTFILLVPMMSGTRT